MFYLRLIRSSPFKCSSLWNVEPATALIQRQLATNSDGISRPVIGDVAGEKDEDPSIVEKYNAFAKARCFNCGQSGHSMRQCPNAQGALLKKTGHDARDLASTTADGKEICFNCGQRGHARRTCPTVRCSRCNAVGHTNADCPNKGGVSKCYNCGQPGHLSRDCPKKLSVNTAGKPDKDTAVRQRKSGTCFSCGKVGHMQRDCPEARCFVCNEIGHISTQCTKRSEC